MKQDFSEKSVELATKAAKSETPAAAEDTSTMSKWDPRLFAIRRPVDQAVTDDTEQLMKGATLKKFVPSQPKRDPVVEFYQTPVEGLGRFAKRAHYHWPTIVLGLAAVRISVTGLSDRLRVTRHLLGKIGLTRDLGRNAVKRMRGMPTLFRVETRQGKTTEVFVTDECIKELYYNSKARGPGKRGGSSDAQ
jgi:hypothetical protein